MKLRRTQESSVLMKQGFSIIEDTIKGVNHIWVTTESGETFFFTYYPNENTTLMGNIDRNVSITLKGDLDNTMKCNCVKSYLVGASTSHKNGLGNGINNRNED